MFTGVTCPGCCRDESPDDRAKTARDRRGGKKSIGLALFGNRGAAIGGGGGDGFLVAEQRYEKMLKRKFVVIVRFERARDPT